MGGVISLVVSKALQLLVNVLLKNASISVLHTITTNKEGIKTSAEFYSPYMYLGKVINAVGKLSCVSEIAMCFPSDSKPQNWKFILSYI